MLVLVRRLSDAWREAKRSPRVRDVIAVVTVRLDMSISYETSKRMAQALNHLCKNVRRFRQQQVFMALVEPSQRARCKEENKFEKIILWMCAVSVSQEAMK